jgi:hypothetical protein
VEESGKETGQVKKEKNRKEGLQQNVRGESIIRSAVIELVMIGSGMCCNGFLV